MCYEAKTETDACGNIFQLKSLLSATLVDLVLFFGPYTIDKLSCRKLKTKTYRAQLNIQTE